MMGNEPTLEQTEDLLWGHRGCLLDPQNPRADEEEAVLRAIIAELREAARLREENKALREVAEAFVDHLDDAIGGCYGENCAGMRDADAMCAYCRAVKILYPEQADG